MQAAALLDSDPQAAARAAAELLKQYPGHRATTVMLGTALRSCGDSQALTIFEELAATQPDSALLQLEFGRTLAALGHDQQAIATLERVVQLEPNLAEAWRELASLYAVRGDTRACDAAHARFTSLSPPEQHLAEAEVAFAHGRLNTAESLLKRQLSREPKDWAAMRMLGEVMGQREDYIEAERLLGECLKLAPGYSRARFDLARLLYSQQKADPVLPLLERLLAFDPEDLLYRSLQASAYGLLGQTERATQIVSVLLKEFPNDERIWLSYGHGQRIGGHPAEAIEAYRKCIELRADFGEAWFSLANLKTFRFSSAEIDAMRSHLARENLSYDDRLQFEFALGKALEDTRNFAESFEHYSRGNELRRSAVAYDGDGNTRLVERSRALYTREFFAARAGFGSQSEEPIFIIGLPRAGSTLLEQILSSHSQVEGTRELPDVPALALELGVRETPGVPPAYPQSVAHLSNAELTRLGARYLAQTLPNRLGGKPRFIDKMPSNFMHLGLIQLMLPRARIIDARRSPLACCFSNFKQHFQSGVWFTYNLEDLGRYYRDYVHLMAHFDTVLPGRVHRVNYETLVADLEGEVRRLLDYCGLPFEDQCLRFHETRRVVQTASSEQVRQPLYAQGVDQWRNYEPWLGKLKEALGDVLPRA